MVSPRTAELADRADGRYLNLPVVDVDSRLVGVVDVLKLTYATLEQINSMSDDGSGGPTFNRFWNSFGTGAPGMSDDGASATSGSVRPGAESQADTPTRGGYSGLDDASSDLHPNDSASAIAADANDSAAMFRPADDGTYLFKFETPSGRVHRFQARYDSYETVREVVGIKLLGDPFFQGPTLTGESGESASATHARPAYDEEGRLPMQIFTPPMPSGPAAATPDIEDYSLAYTDDDGDLVLITADSDVHDAVKVARHHGRDRVVLILHGGKTWEDAIRARGGDPHAMHPRRQHRHGPGAAGLGIHDEAHASHGRPGARPPANDTVLGFLPKDMALPAAIGFLGVAVIGAVAAMRFGGVRV